MKSLTEEISNSKKRLSSGITGSSAPFMVFWERWLEYESFWSIGQRVCSLAIVAPGIAEALLATIIGLGAAIPAVIA